MPLLLQLKPDMHAHIKAYMDDTYLQKLTKLKQHVLSASQLINNVSIRQAFLYTQATNGILKKNISLWLFINKEKIACKLELFELPRH